MKPGVIQLGPYPPPMGGVQTNLAAIHQMLTERGYPSFVINLTRFRAATAGSIFYPDGALAVLRLLWSLPARIIHLHVGGDLSRRLVLLGLACTLLPGRRTVFSFHSGGYPDSPAGRSAGWWTLRGFALRRFDRLIAVNTQLADLFARFGVSRHKIQVILPYVLPDTVPDTPLPAPLAAFYQNHDPVLLSMGWLEPEYDFQLQIQVLPALRARWPRAGLVILGEGRLRPELEAQSQASGLSEHILLAGDQPHPLALQAIRRSQVFLRTTHYDGDAISVREALHLGTPVVASDNGMRPAGVHLFQARDPESLQQAIAQALSTPPPEPGFPGSGKRNIEQILALYEQLNG
jgi:glycogen(starch) synthase